MERLTEQRGARSWFLFHLSWYLNLALFLIAVGFAAYYFIQLRGGSTNQAHDTVMMMSCLILGAILLLGAGISRYQARVEGQHLELKNAIVSLREGRKEAGPEKEKAAPVA